MNSSPRVGIVILNWKSPDQILDCLRSLALMDYPSFEVVVVDNASNNGSVPVIRSEFPTVDIIENGRNLGFAAGCNVGIRHLLCKGADYILLLNDDTEVRADLLARLVEVGEQRPEVGVLGPMICYFSAPNVIWSAGGAIDRYGSARHPGADETDSGLDRTPREVDYITGCALLIKRSAVEAVGLLDERFFAYFEETEWCARVRRHGFRVLYVPTAKMWHKVERDQRGSSRLYLYLMARNRLLYVRCTTAGLAAVAVAMLDVLRTAASWTIRPRHRQMRPFATALTRGVFHFAIGRFGAPPARP